MQTYPANSTLPVQATYGQHVISAHTQRAASLIRPESHHDKRQPCVFASKAWSNLSSTHAAETEVQVRGIEDRRKDMNMKKDM